MARQTKRKYPVQGKDYHGWAWEYPDGDLSWWAEASHTLPTTQPLSEGRWVRVKFIICKKGDTP